MVRAYRDGMKEVVAYLQGRPELLTEANRPRILTREERESISHAWKMLLDYNLAMDSLRRYYSDWSNLKNRRSAPFHLERAAFLAQYRFALEFIALMEQNPDMDVTLNDAVPELGLPPRTYAAFKFRFLNVARATEYAAFGTAAMFMKRDKSSLRATTEEDHAAIGRFGLWEGEKLTVDNGLKILQDKALEAWFPVQSGVAEWMGDVRLTRQGVALISSDQIAALGPLLEPGDILFTRREWFLSNIGLPGFWLHGALYIGTPEERRRYFADEAVQHWLRASGAPDIESLLRVRTPSAYELGSTPQDEHPPRILEAMAEGVIFNSLETSASADSLVALRPRLPKAAKARAILRAFQYSGRPYDFNFDFRTDSALVCTELLYKCYEPTPELAGLRLPVSMVLGRPVVPANEIVRQFDEQYDTEKRQFDFIRFLDGFEREKSAVESTLPAFRESWKRPKWHILVQNPPTPAEAGVRRRQTEI